MKQSMTHVMRLVKEKILVFMSQGMTPRDLALALALGVALGTFPVLGATTMLCIIAGIALRLNLPAIQSVNWMISPLQLILLVPFFELGSALFGGGAVTVSVGDLIGLMRVDFFGTIRAFLVTTLKAICAWGLVAPIIAVLVFIVALPLLTGVQLEYVRIRTDRNQPHDGHIR
jgi:uncharacterized protein (DUF2062 family)